MNPSMGLVLGFHMASVMLCSIFWVNTIQRGSNYCCSECFTVISQSQTSVFATLHMRPTDVKNQTQTPQTPLSNHQHTQRTER